MSDETTQVPPTATAPKPGQPGYKPSRETLRKMQEGRRKKDQEKKDKAAREAAARVGAQTRAPSAPTAAVPEKMRKKIAEMIVAPAIGLAAASGFFVARRITAPAVPLKDDGTGQMVPAVTELEYAAMVQAWRRGAYKDDELEKWERDWIGDELTTELVRYPRVRALLVQLVAIAERGGLAQAVSVVIAWRMVQHEMLPPEFLELAREAVTEMRANARKARKVIDEAEPASTADNGAGSAPSPHFTERVA